MNEKNTGENGAAVIVSGGPGRDYPCVRSLRRHGITTIFARTDRKSPVPASRFCDQTYQLPSPKNSVIAFRNELLELAAKPNVKTIVPAREDSVYVLSKWRDTFQEHVSIVVPSFEALHSVHDRLRLAEIATEAGVPVPETRLVTDVDDWRQSSVIKSRYNLLTTDYVDGFPRDRVDIVKSITHLARGERPDVTAIYEKMHHLPIIQEYIPSDDEFVFAALYDHGEPVATFQHRQIRGNSYTGGGGVYRKSVYIEELQSVAERLLGALEWHGLACIEFMRHADTGEFVLTEINPRTWQSLSAAVRAGVDFPHYYWLAAMGCKSAIEPGYNLGVGTHSLYGELDHFSSLFVDQSPNVDPPPVDETVWAILRSLYEDPHFDYTRLDDPGPFVRAVAYVARMN